MTNPGPGCTRVRKMKLRRLVALAERGVVEDRYEACVTVTMVRGHANII